MSLSDHVLNAIEAAGSLNAFRRIGYSSTECLAGHAKNLSDRDRCEFVGYHQLGLSAMSEAVKIVARKEYDEDWRALLLASASALDALQDIEELKPARVVGFGAR
jgi:hypothetical protein